MKNCEKCEYFGRPGDAPETVEKDCMYFSYPGTGGTKPPCDDDKDCDLPYGPREKLFWER